MTALTLRSSLLSIGVTDGEVRRALRDGALTTIRRGTYLAGQPPEHPDERHLLLVQAARRHLVPDAVVSHVSAALLHGIDLWSAPMGRVHVTRARAYGGRRGQRVHVHVAPLMAEAVRVVDGVPVTSVARTVVDVARTEPFEQAVVAADSALHKNLVTPDELAAAVEAAKGWPGAPRARRVVSFADGRSESVGESRSRVRMAAAGIPVPVLQWRVVGRAGEQLGITDFAWPERSLVGEFDGKVKYGRLVRPGETPADAVFREKRREDAIRATGSRMLRWTWDALDTFTAELAHILR
jgi:hypothetical protein